MLAGTQIGAYRVLHQIGEGGMGAVWLAEHAMLGRRAAIKVLLPEYSRRADIVTRFFNEARAATAIADPGIVQIFDFGEHTDGSAYIVMELLDGEPLDKRLSRQGPLAVPDALRIMRQVASTLGAAHARGIVHRDLKPENIFMVRDPEVPGGERAKVLDFGIAKIAGARTGVKTQTSAVMGTPAYMSPEQCRGAGHVDERSDVYALGCVLFALLCGRPPFDAEGAGEIIAMHLREPPPVPSMLRPGLPPEVDQIVLRCLAKDPAQRFASGVSLATELGASVGSSPQIAASSGRYLEASAPTTLSSAIGAGTVPPARKGRRLAIVATLGLAVGGAAIAIVVPGHDDTTTPRSTGTQPSATDSAFTDAASSVASTIEPPNRERPLEIQRPEPTVEVAARMKTIFVRFVTWSRDHRGAPCPEIDVLGVASDDPWGQPIQITCTDQPAGQIIGAVSTGPDGRPGTGDDVASWQLGRDVTDVIRGPRWVAGGPSAPPLATSPPPAKKSRKTPATSVKPEIPTRALELDANGLPVAR